MLKDAMVLAAGKSTRIAEVCGDLPKPLIELAGEPILIRNIRWLASQGIRDIWINLHYRGDDIVQVVGDGSAWGVSVRYSHEEEILGTAGGVRKLREHWTAPFWVVYGDNLVSFLLERMERHHSLGQFALTVALFDTRQHSHTGIAGGRVLLDDNGRITNFVEQGHEISPYVNAGVYLVSPGVLDWVPEGEFFDFGHQLFPLLLELEIPIGGHLIDGYCLGIDTPHALQRANELIELGEIVPL
ncbi:MAG: nucleotidyltransferase family protein [Acidobacteria bacterium]|nr:nucleotidyltransferase family protein [Acidobacteriota bacterium]